MGNGVCLMHGWVRLRPDCWVGLFVLMSQVDSRNAHIQQRILT
jgi:hypothetical protein